MSDFVRHRVRFSIQWKGRILHEVPAHSDSDEDSYKLQAQGTPFTDSRAVVRLTACLRALARRVTVLEAAR